MKNKTVFCSLFLSHCLLLSLQAKQENAPCPSATHPMRVTMRHIEPGGIGYNEGYTTIEGFFSAPLPYKERWLPFADLRGHIFNSGKMAANTGIGMRYVQPSRLYGASLYYDYRNTHHSHYNQLSLALETLGTLWDGRINGYLPVGAKASPYYSTKFSRFSGSSAYLSRKKEYAMKGINAEAGYHIDHFHKVPMYLAAGPYYLQGHGQHAIGGQLRAAADIFDHFKLSANVSYDNIYQWVGQGQLGLSIAFGGKKKAKRLSSTSCSKEKAINTRLRQPVDRFEIIPVDTKKSTTKAINPATGAPWVFWFVDNTSNSSGTWQSPYHTLQDAAAASKPNEVIYVFPGDGTSRGLDNGITLKDGQWLVSSSYLLNLPTTLGTFTIPSYTLASNKPLITNTTGDIVTLANNNFIQGLSFNLQQPTFSGIKGTGITNLTAGYNDFLATENTNGIYITGSSSGDVNIYGCTFDNFKNTVPNSFFGVGIYIDNVVVLNRMHVEKNTFSNFGTTDTSLAGYSIINFGKIDNLTANNNIFESFKNSFAIVNPGTIGILSTLNNIFNKFESNSFGIRNSPSGKITSLMTFYNTFQNFNSSSGLSNAGTITTLSASDNTFQSFTTSTGIYNTSNATINSLIATSNAFQNFTNSTAIRNISNATINSLTATSNTFQSFTNSTAIRNISNATINSLTATSNTFQSFTNSSYGIYNSAAGIITTLSAAGNTFDSFENSYGIYNGKTIGNLTATSNIFKDLVSSNGIYNSAAGTITTLSAYSNFFDMLTNSKAISNNSTGYISTFTANSNTFTNLNNSNSSPSYGVYNIHGSNTQTASITNNTFTTTTIDYNNNGYAVYVQVNGGSTCLNFTGNTAPTTTTPPAYYFYNNNATLNLTSASTPNNNVGTIQKLGTIGSCTQ
jgi:hypothetical protein